ncbi:KOW domain-containing RNA-binding protein [Zongyangia hominis]|uniref:KOW domain-containing RNA-binding protein n=1 Tax=Zongyangia hominis TaxID=2763677 RepID=A0A926ED87_9FIRM|nr:KOW domain-containing RNA-binding protein [Zongyangia hominis]MBC8570274.1 KOW domain-containing RNA-binding protein [Zongyangia hominis]
MKVTKGCVVKSMAGHDGGRFYLVLEVRDGFATIADGKERKLERPKRKNLRHLAPTNKVLDVETLTTNNQLRRALREYNGPLDAPQKMGEQ